MMTRKERSLAATAYHEAGHAVAAWHFGIRFKYVTIRPEVDSLGHVLQIPQTWFRPDIEFNDRVALRAQRYIIGAFAGQIAEGKFRRRRPRFGMVSDERKAVDMAMHCCGSKETTFAYLKYCFAASKDLVVNRWKEIQAVATALLERGTLTYKETRSVITGKAHHLESR